MIKLRKIFWFSTLAVGFYLAACKQDKDFDHKYDYMLGKWKYDWQSELWIDEKFVFDGDDDFPVMSEYEILNDTMFIYWPLDAMNKSIQGKHRVPVFISSDTIQFGTTKYYRIAPGIPLIDTSRTWQREALTEIVRRRQALIK